MWKGLSWGIPFAAVVVATLLTFPLRQVAAHSLSVFFFIAVMLTAYWKGLPAGLLSAVLAVLSFDYYFDSRPYELDFRPAALVRMSAFTVAAAFVAYLTARERRVVQELRSANEALRQAQSEIVVLQGILPVCMHCKQIRTDAGVWQQMEKYISEHSEAKFSHGVCPECCRKHYPDVYSKA